MRISVSSTNGEDLDLHFGKSSSVYIYDYDEAEDELSFIEHRTIEIDAESKHQNKKILKGIEDCQIAICAQFGPKSNIYAEDAGIKLVKEEGTVEEALNSYIEHYKFMKNIKI